MEGLPPQDENRRENRRGEKRKGQNENERGIRVLGLKGELWVGLGFCSSCFFVKRGALILSVVA